MDCCSSRYGHVRFTFYSFAEQNFFTAFEKWAKFVSCFGFVKLNSNLTVLVPSVRQQPLSGLVRRGGSCG